MVSILVVEDSEANVEILKNLLERRGYDVTTARSGSAAFEWLENNLPDLILTDINMPGMDGFEVCSRLKADERTAEIPVIFISALDDTENLVKAFKVGGADYITKPFRFMEVVARVQNHLMIARQRQQIQELRDQDRKQFESISKMKNHFIGTATHDLKNPLMVILGYVALMERQEQTRDNPVFEKSLQAIRDGVGRMSELVSDMLDLVQLESRAELVKERQTINTLLEACVKDFEVMSTDITLSLETPPENIQCLIDSSGIKRVIDNLISNAIKYSTTGGSVTVRLQADDQDAIIEVTDTGLGIPEEEMPHLFDTFYRVKHEAHRQVDGTGLGLAIVKTIIDQHDGQVEVRSKLGEGSTFTIRLPRKLEEAVGSKPV